MWNEKLHTNGNLCSVVTFAVIIRWAVSLHSYSGQNTPPMFGDYEAQRHWMEITVNLPVKEWYFNTSDNDLMYWGLDYPPLTAYHSYINGKIAQAYDPNFVKLFASRGYESAEHKFFMRSTVIVTDIIIYFLPIIFFYNSIFKSNFKCAVHHGENSDIVSQKATTFKNFNTYVTYLAQIAIALLYPGLILIDHGHFQYNSISLGLTVAAVTALAYNSFLFSAFFFCLALNYKQMSLYHSLPFFIYMLRHCFSHNKSFNFFKAIKRLSYISFTVILTFSVIWFPFLMYGNMPSQVIKRLFPLSRGIFEDKVSNVWCSVNVIFKLNKAFNQVQMAQICILCVLITSTTSLFNLFKNPNLMKLILSLINVSLSFFLFSYQVHEKSILLVALPILLYFPFNPFPCFWFLLISNFSMLPLLLKDKLIIPFISLTFLFSLFVYANVDFQIKQEKKFNTNWKKLLSKKNIDCYLFFKLSMIGCVLLFLCLVFIKPPARYPDIWPLLCSVYSCMHFCLFFIYFNYIQVFKTN